MWSAITSALTFLDSQRLYEICRGIDVLTIFRNPLVIAIVGITCVVFIIRRMQRTLIAFLSIPAMLALIQTTVQQHNVLDFRAEKILVLVVGSFLIAALNVYFCFMRPQSRRRH